MIVWVRNTVQVTIKSDSFTIAVLERYKDKAKLCYIELN